jgi:isopentenyl-diphosphate delta-isomerase
MPSSFVPEPSIGGKIKVAPPLPCQFAGEDCRLVQIDASSMVIEFPDGRRPEMMASSFQIGLKSFLDQSIGSEVTGKSSAGWNLKPVTREDALSLQNLLTVLRKEQHIKICTEQDVESSTRSTGLELFHLRPKTLPELAWEDVDTSTQIFGRRFSYPFLITGMTGGVEQGAEINRRLAAAAGEFDIPMGVGSQRLALTDSKYCDIFRVKQHTPSLFLIGNIGVNQLKKGQELGDCERAVEMIQADALALHVNVLQELIQEEGDRDFRHILDRIATVANHLSVPVVVKEVGSGFDIDSARELAARGIRCIDVGGQGGTSWGFIEGQRSNNSGTKSLGETFRNWGIPTAHSLRSLRRLLPEMELIATGGIRDGLMIAKSIALGATMAGIGLPLFRAAVESDAGPFSVLDTMARGLKIAMLCSGSPRLSDLEGRIFSNSDLTDQLIGN